MQSTNLHCMLVAFLSLSVMSMCCIMFRNSGQKTVYVAVLLLLTQQATGYCACILNCCVSACDADLMRWVCVSSYQQQQQLLVHNGGSNSS